MTATTPSEARWARVLSLLWRLWGQLGLSTWDSQPVPWGIELEPLIVATGCAGPRDPRLLREAVDWSVANDRFVSIAQLRQVIRSHPWPDHEAIHAFGATVSQHTRRRWPGDGPPHALSLSGKSREPDLQRPSLLGLRLRAMFGTSARAELLRVLLTSEGPQAARQLAERVPYTRRQLELDLEMLVLSGLVARTGDLGPATYLLAHPRPLRKLVGPVPEVTPAWAPLLAALLAALTLADELTTGQWQAPEVEVTRRWREIATPAARAGLAPRSTPDDLPSLLAWTDQALTSVDGGQPLRGG